MFLRLRSGRNWAIDEIIFSRSSSGVTISLLSWFLRRVGPLYLYFSFSRSCSACFCSAIASSPYCSWMEEISSSCSCRISYFSFCCLSCSSFYRICRVSSCSCTTRSMFFRFLSGRNCAMDERISWRSISFGGASLTTFLALFYLYFSLRRSCSATLSSSVSSGTIGVSSSSDSSPFFTSGSRGLRASSCWRICSVALC